MARRSGAEKTYEAARRFRDECLSSRASLLWPARQPWSAHNLQALWKLFIDHPDSSERSFLEKLKSQLESASDDIVRVAADIIAFYFLFPTRIGADTKISRVREVAAWKRLDNDMELTFIEQAYAEGGIGFPGTYYSTGLPWHFAFLIRLGVECTTQRSTLTNPETLEQITRKAADQISASTAVIRNVTLHLFDPENFERIASDPHKGAILQAFGSLDPKTGSVDSRLRHIRGELGKELGRQNFDFYDREVASRWHPKEDDTEPPLNSPKVWIEKTIVRDRADRMNGPHALGQALWSPQRGQGGQDIYRFMRDVRPGDVVLHLTDNSAFTGISRVHSPADDSFVGLPGTDWASKPAYRVQLTDFQQLKPPLAREVFFSEPYAQQLKELIKAGKRNLFFNSEPSLNQGAYLTPAPEQLVAILNAAYLSIAQRPLFDSRMPLPPSPAGQASPTSLLAVCAGFSAALRESGVTFGDHHETVARSFIIALATKGFAILTGLSGSGKTQIALRFGEWLGDEKHLVVPVRPDWTGAEAFFGFEDALQPVVNGRRSWHVPEGLRFILNAARDPSHCYLLLLDEMNLAHVERYFADVLSGMESGENCLPNLVEEPDGHWRLKYMSDSKIPIPKNLFVVGTVNVDETTYMFSPKVLDRANTFEFRVRTDDLVTTATRPKACEPGDEGLTQLLLSLASNPDSHRGYLSPTVDAFADHFRRLHRLLTPLGFEFGHRTFLEAIRFASLFCAVGESDPYKPLDLQVMQKILPRVHGSRRRLEPVMSALGRFCLDPEDFETGGGSDKTPFDPLAPLRVAPALPFSFDKVRRMTHLLRANQFVSFAE